MKTVFIIITIIHSLFPTLCSGFTTIQQQQQQQQQQQPPFVTSSRRVVNHNIQSATQTRTTRIRIRKRKKSVLLYNFLDDFKNEQENDDMITDPSSSSASAFPPPICPSEIYRIRFSTTAGDFTIRLDRSLSPSGITRFLELVDDNFFIDQYLYRVEPGFVIQFGVSSSPLKQGQWDPQAGSPVGPLPDEPNRQLFQKGSVSFAGSGVNSRSCHVFIVLDEPAPAPDASSETALFGNALHETVLGNVEHEDGGMLVLDQLVRNREELGYGNLLDVQGSLVREGNSALDRYPGVDRIVACGRLM